MSNLSQSIGSLAGMLNQAEQRSPVMLALEFIDAAPQVRTAFDEEALQQLAEDIAQRGVRSPIEVRAMPDGRWLVVAGERRLRAARLAGKTEIPAYVEELDDEAAEDAQLLENIQREDLSTADIAALIGRRYDRLKKKGAKTPLDDIAKMFKKSTSWVSKHLALATRLSPEVANLLASGVTQDIEILLALQKLHGLSPSRFYQQVEALKAGKATRATVRHVLEEAQAAQDELKAKAKDKPKAKAAKAPAAGIEPLAFDPHDALFQATYHGDGADMAEVVAQWPEDGRNAVSERLAVHWQAGSKAAASGPAGAVPELMRHYRMAQESEGEIADFRAFLAGLAGEQFDPVAILASTRDFNAQEG